MKNPELKRLWELYPESHLHCDVTSAGADSFEVVASLIDKSGDVVAQVTYYGSGNLDSLKDTAFELLVAELQQVANS